MFASYLELLLIVVCLHMSLFYVTIQCLTYLTLWRHTLIKNLSHSVYKNGKILKTKLFNHFENFSLNMYFYYASVTTVRGHHYVLPLSVCLSHILVSSLCNQLLPQLMMDQFETLHTC